MKKFLLIPILLLSGIVLSGCNLIATREQNSTSASPCSGGTCNLSTAELEQAIAPSPTDANNVPLPTGEDVVRTFFNLINEKRISDAVGMLSKIANPDQSSKQQWGVSFESFANVSVTSIEHWNENEWSENRQVYKVNLDITIAEGAQSFGWDAGPNTRWLELVKEPDSNLWKINSIATGP